MKNLNTFKIFCTIFILFATVFGCQIKKNINSEYEGYSGIRSLEWDLRIAIKKNKSGIYEYKKLGTNFLLKNGNFNGEFKVIIDTDTVYYCNFKNNLPIGRYVFNSLHSKNKNYYNRIIPQKPSIDFGSGKGFFNDQHQKEGVWIENRGNCVKKGTYKKDKKEGVWEENCFEDVGGFNTNKTFIYKNDVIIRTE